jgi:hypothetical protein
MKALILAVSMVLVAASCGGATPDSSGSCGTGLTCCLPTE